MSTKRGLCTGKIKQSVIMKLFRELSLIIPPKIK